MPAAQSAPRKDPPRPRSASRAAAARADRSKAPPPRPAPPSTRAPAPAARRSTLFCGRTARAAPSSGSPRCIPTPTISPVTSSWPSSRFSCSMCGFSPSSATSPSPVSSTTSRSLKQLTAVTPVSFCARASVEHQGMPGICTVFFSISSPPLSGYARQPSRYVRVIRRMAASPAPARAAWRAREEQIQRLIHVQPTGRAAEPPRRASIQKLRRGLAVLRFFRSEPAPPWRIASRRAALWRADAPLVRPDVVYAASPHRNACAPSVSPQQTMSSGCTTSPRAAGWRTRIVRPSSSASHHAAQFSAQGRRVAHQHRPNRVAQQPPRCAQQRCVCRMLASIPRMSARRFPPPRSPVRRLDKPPHPTSPAAAARPPRAPPASA